MTKYLLSVYYDDDTTQPSPEEMSQIVRDVDAVHKALEAEGAWVFGGGLHEAGTATVVRAGGGDVLTTDGPFVETKEQLGGFSIIDAADLDAALEWARQTSEATRCPIEVRPFQDDAA